MFSCKRLFSLYLLFIWSLCIVGTIGTMRLNTNSAFRAILTPELKTLAAIFEKHGFKDDIRIVGGAVRDIINGHIPADVDLATSATPQEMKDMFKIENIATFNEKGLENHGTVSIRIKKECFEISSLRDEIKVDGKVDNMTFIKDWFIDSTRRDLTINAMYIDLEGNLYDYHNGYEDLKNNRIVFIGEPKERIREDPIRILRYFRLFAKVAKNANHNHDEDVLRAIRDNASKVDKIFGPRLWVELRGILVGNFVNEIVKTMLDVGLAPYMGLGQDLTDLDMTCFDFVCRNVGKYSFEAITIIASLLRRMDQVRTFNNRMKLSYFEKGVALFIVKHKSKPLPHEDEQCLKHFQQILIHTFTNPEGVHTGVVELLKVVDRGSVAKLISEWTVPKLQITYSSLKEKGIEIDQRQVGQFMQKLREEWFHNDFIVDDDLINTVAREFQNKTKI